MLENNNLKEKVKKWFEKQGYPLEMRVADSLQQRGFHVIQSDYYVDPQSGDQREIDVVSYMQEDISKTLFRVSLLIECKLSIDKPWLLFTSNNIKISSKTRIAQCAANSLGRDYLFEIAYNKEVQDLPIFKLPERPAYGLTQALTNGKDVCYSAVTSVSKAVLATINEFDEMQKNFDKTYSVFRSNICLFIFPVIVVEGSLFEAFLSDNSKVSFNQIETGTLFWRNPIIGRPYTIVNVVSSNVFDRFVQETHQSIADLFTLSHDQLYQSFTKAFGNEAQRAFNSPDV